jgi:hypothetical protein
LPGATNPRADCDISGRDGAFHCAAFCLWLPQKCPRAVGACRAPLLPTASDLDGRPRSDIMRTEPLAY